MSGKCQHCGKKGFDFDLAHGSGPDCLDPMVRDPAVGGWTCQYKPAEPEPTPKTLGEIIRAAHSGERPGYDDLRLALCALDHLMTFDRMAMERPLLAQALKKTPMEFLGDNNPDNPEVQANRVRVKR